LLATSVEEIDKAFATASQQAVAALFVANDPYLDSQRDQIIALAARAAIPAMYYTLIYGGRRLDQLWRQHRRSLSSGRHLHR
jgi:hypothetical protein